MLLTKCIVCETVFVPMALVGSLYCSIECQRFDTLWRNQPDGQYEEEENEMLSGGSVRREEPPKSTS